MSEENMSGSYEVGYGKPPKDTQFKKGSSGNPRGRPKKALDFYDELLRQSRAIVTINENGRRRRISKHALVIKQMINNAIRGDMPATRAYLGHHQIGSEKEALREASKSSDPKKCVDINEFTDEELMQMIVDDRKARGLETKPGHILNAD